MAFASLVWALENKSSKELHIPHPNQGCGESMLNLGSP